MGNVDNHILQAIRSQFLSFLCIFFLSCLKKVSEADEKIFLIKIQINKVALITLEFIFKSK
jgi:hypothetical protein